MHNAWCIQYMHMKHILHRVTPVPAGRGSGSMVSLSISLHLINSGAPVSSSRGFSTLSQSAATPSSPHVSRVQSCRSSPHLTSVLLASLYWQASFGNVETLPLEAAHDLHLTRSTTWQRKAERFDAFEKCIWLLSVSGAGGSHQATLGASHSARRALLESAWCPIWFYFLYFSPNFKNCFWQRTSCGNMTFLSPFLHLLYRD
jgi:hypothetical protein